MDFLKATKHTLQNVKKLGQKYNQRSGRELSKTRPQKFHLIVAVKISSDQIIIVFLISYLVSTLNFSSVKLEKKTKMKQLKRSYNVDTDSS